MNTDDCNKYQETSRIFLTHTVYSEHQIYSAIAVSSQETDFSFMILDGFYK